MKCAVCGKDLSGEDGKVVKNVGVTCAECYNSLSEKAEHGGRAKSVWPKLMYIVALIVFVVGIVGGFYITKMGTRYTQAIDIVLMLTIWFFSTLVAAITAGIGRVIDLLTEIADKK